MSPTRARRHGLAVAVAASLVLPARLARSDPARSMVEAARCVERTTELLRHEGAPRTRLARAACEETLGLLIEAKADAREAGDLAAALHDFALARAARVRFRAIEAKVPRITLRRMGDADAEIAVTLDDRPIEAAWLDTPMPVDPGSHRVHAEGRLRGALAVFDREVRIDAASHVELRLALASGVAPATAARPAPDEESGESAGGAGEEVAAAGPGAPSRGQEHEPASGRASGGGSPVDVRVTLDVGGYTDSNHVDVLSPSVSGTLSSPTAGWHVSGSYLVDVVSAASPDIVSEASPPFREVRHAGTLSGGYKPGRYGGEVSAHVSSEPDYLSMGGGFAVLGDSADKLVTPRLALDFSHDTIGRGSTPFSAFHHDLDTLEVEAGCTFVLSASSVLLVGGTAELERGDQSKPYRYVPLFDPATAARVAPGQSVASVNAARESIRPLEQLPTARNRYAAGARFLHRFVGSTLRVEERLFTDSWQQSATTSDLRHMFDVAPWLRLWPHLRLHAQTGANFYRLAYSPRVDPADNQLAVPTYRTDDRELGPLFTLTGGGGVRLTLSPPTSDTRIALQLEGDVMYSRYPLSLFITSRTAIYSTFGVEAEIE